MKKSAPSCPSVKFKASKSAKVSIPSIPIEPTDSNSSQVLPTSRGSGSGVEPATRYQKVPSEKEHKGVQGSITTPKKEGRFHSQIPFTPKTYLESSTTTPESSSSTSSQEKYTQWETPNRNDCYPLTPLTTPSLPRSRKQSTEAASLVRKSDLSTPLTPLSLSTFPKPKIEEPSPTANFSKVSPSKRPQLSQNSFDDGIHKLFNTTGQSATDGSGIAQPSPVVEGAKVDASAHSRVGNAKKTGISPQEKLPVCRAIDFGRESAERQGPETSNTASQGSNAPQSTTESLPVDSGTERIGLVDPFLPQSREKHATSEASSHQSITHSQDLSKVSSQDPSEQPQQRSTTANNDFKPNVKPTQTKNLASSLGKSLDEIYKGLKTRSKTVPFRCAGLNNRKEPCGRIVSKNSDALLILDQIKKISRGAQKHRERLEKLAGLVICTYQRSKQASGIIDMWVLQLEDFINGSEESTPNSANIEQSVLPNLVLVEVTASFRFTGRKMTSQDLGLSLHPSPSECFIPYPPSKWKARHSSNYLIRIALTKHLSPKQELKDGWIYIYWTPCNIGRVKIGVTTVSVEKRLKAWAGCKRKIEGSASTQKIPHAYRVEALVQQELASFRRVEVECAGCPKRSSHIEWFEISIDHALDVIKKWSSWIMKRPYEPVESAIAPMPTWKLRAQHMNDLLTLCEAIPMSRDVLPLYPKKLQPPVLRAKS